MALKPGVSRGAKAGEEVSDYDLRKIVMKTLLTVCLAVLS